MFIKFELSKLAENFTEIEIPQKNFRRNEKIEKKT